MSTTGPLNGGARPPHPATLQKQARPGSAPPHAAKIAQPSAAKAPHPATVQARARLDARAPHPAAAPTRTAQAVQRSALPNASSSSGPSDELAGYALIDGKDIGGARPGLYPRSISDRTFKKFQVPRDHEKLLFWFARNNEAYPTEEDARQGGLAPNGGVRRDCDDAVGTFAVYNCSGDEKKRIAKLFYWVDYDHTPIDGDDSAWKIRADLSEGHYHPGNKIGEQIPITERQKQLGAAVLAYAKKH